MKCAWVVAILVFCGCTPALTFHADDAVTHPQSRPSASRLMRARADCETLGTITFNGDHVMHDSDVDGVAEKVASVGGTHYIVRDRTITRRDGKVHPFASVVAVLMCANHTARTTNRHRI